MVKKKQISIYSDTHALLVLEKLKRSSPSLADTLKEIIEEWVKK